MKNENGLYYSIVVPVFCESDSLGELTKQIHETMKSITGKDSFEILYIDDGSTDDTPETIDALQEKHTFVKNIRLRRNRGKAFALMTGFHHAKGDVVITLDGDLQDDPSEIPILLEKLNEGNDLVTGRRQARHDGGIRKYGSRLFNWTVKRTTGLNLHDINCGFKVYRSEVVKSICLYGQYHRYIPVLAHLNGFKVAEAPVENRNRIHGESKYRAIRYEGVFDLLSLLFLNKYGLNPLHFFGIFSLFLIVPALALIGYLVCLHFLSVIGFGQEFQLVTRPLFSLGLTALLLGVIIFLTGFVCDFILHHQIRSIMPNLISLAVENRPKKKTD